MILAGDFIPKNLKVRLPDEFKGQLVLANLEGPICADGLPKSNKVGVCLRSEVAELSGWGVEKFAFSLANNHMMDYGEEGLRQTKEVLDAHDIPYAGAGANEEEARKPMILKEDGHRIAVFSCCERQFGMAMGDTAGCAAKGPWLYSAIREIKTLGQADYVIVSCHAASEFSPWPCPVLRDFYHSLIDAGADCIHGHHSHVPQGFEEYHGKPIFYGLGNFVVNADDWCACPNFLWSLIVQVQFSDYGIGWTVLPYAVRVRTGTIEVGWGQDAVRQEYIRLANLPFLSSEVSLVGCWQESACKLFPRLYSMNIKTPSASPFKLTVRERIRKLYGALGDIGRVVVGRECVTRKSTYYAKVQYNGFNCESHCETIQAALGVWTGCVPDFRSVETASVTESLMNGLPFI